MSTTPTTAPATARRSGMCVEPQTGLLSLVSGAQETVRDWSWTENGVKAKHAECSTLGLVICSGAPCLLTVLMHLRTVNP
jgi:hypothetical protein